MRQNHSNNNELEAFNRRLNYAFLCCAAGSFTGIATPLVASSFCCHATSSLVAPAAGGGFGAVTGICCGLWLSKNCDSSAENEGTSNNRSPEQNDILVTTYEPTPYGSSLMEMT